MASAGPSNGVKDLTGSVSGSAPTTSSAAVNYLGTWNTTIRTPEGDDSSSGIWSVAAATAQGDPHTPSASDPLPYRFALVFQALTLTLDSTGYDVETAGTYQKPEGSVVYEVTENDPGIGKHHGIVRSLEQLPRSG